MSGGVEIKGIRFNTVGPVDTGISIADCEHLTVRDCSVFANTFPHDSLEWLTQHPSLRRRARVARFRRQRGWKDAA